MGLEVKGDMIKRGEKQVSGKEKKEDEENKINHSDYCLLYTSEAADE